MKINRHQYMPTMSDEEFSALKESILEYGVVNPVLKDRRGNILDGHHRDMAWRELVAQGHELPPYPVRVVKERFTTTEEKSFVRSVNMVRRHLSRPQRRKLVGEQLVDTPDWTNRRIGEFLGVSDTLVRSVREELEDNGVIQRHEVLIRADGRKHVRSPSPAWSELASSEPSTRPQAPTEKPHPAEVQAKPKTQPKVRKAQAVGEPANALMAHPSDNGDVKGSMPNTISPEQQTETAHKTPPEGMADKEVIDIMISGGLKVCEYAVSRHESDAYKMSPEDRWAHIQRWNRIRSRIRELGKEFKAATAEREVSGV